MVADLKIIWWRFAELVVYVLTFPFLFIGAWGNVASDWCHDRAVDVQIRKRRS